MQVSDYISTTLFQNCIAENNIKNLRGQKQEKSKKIFNFFAFSQK